MFELRFTPRAERDLDRLTESLRGRVMRRLNQLTAWPEHGLGVRLLRGRGRREWRVRIGCYRAIFRVNEEQRVIWVTRVGHRQSVYQ